MPSRRIAALSLALVLLCVPVASSAAADENPFNVGVVPHTSPASLSIQTAAIPAATTAQTPPAATQATPPPPEGVILPLLAPLRVKATSAAAALASALTSTLASAQSAAGEVFHTLSAGFADLNAPLASARGSIISASHVTDVIRAATNAAHTVTASLPFLGEPAPRNENADLSSPGTHPQSAASASAVPSELNASPTHPLAATAASAAASGLTLAPTGAPSGESPETHPQSALAAIAASVAPSGLQASPTASPTASGIVARDLPNQPDQPNQPKESTGRVLGAQTAAAPATAYITLDQFSAGLSGLGDIFARAFGNTAVTRVPEQVAAAGNAAVSYFPPASQRIDQLSNTAITAPTITGGTISNASISGYLPLSGGSLSGALSAGTLTLSDTLTGTDATFSGTLTAGTLNVAGVSSQGALTGPYFNATSTTATSTFAGGLTAANGGFSILQNGSVGIGTTSPQSQFALSGWTVNSGESDLPDYASGNPQMRIDGTLNTSLTPAHVTGFQGIWNTSGGGTTNVNGMRLQLDAGYTGSGVVRVFQVQNLVQGTQHLNVADESGNIGASLRSQSGAEDNSTVGDNIGVYAIANGSQNLNTAIYARSFDQGAAGGNSVVANVGVIGTAGTFNGRDHGQALIGGLFTIGTGSGWKTSIGSTSAALILDNQTSGAPLLMGRVNSTSALTLTGTGGIVSTSTADATDFWRVHNSSGTPLFDLDTSNLRVGIGTTTPSNTLTVSSPNTVSSLSIRSAGNSVSSGNVRMDLANGDGNSYGWQYSGNGGTILRFQYNGGTVGVFNTDGSLALGDTGSASAALTGSMFFVNGVQYIGSRTNSGSKNLLALAGGNIAADNLGFISNPATNTWSLGYSATHDAGVLATPALTWNSSGNVGIGTTTPWGKLSVTGSGTGTGLAFAVADSANTPRFVIQDNGNVSIGPTNPSTLLSVDGNLTNNYPIKWTNSGSGFAYADTAGSGITNANPYTSGALVYLTGNNIQFYNGSSVGATISNGTLALTGTTGTTTIAAGQGFTIGGSQFIVQQGSGNVGIGTAGPSATLHINNNAAVTSNGILLITGVSDNPFVIQDNQPASTWMHVGSLFAANAAADNNVVLGIGKQSTTRNSGYIGFNYSSNASANNYLTFGLNGVDHVLNITGGGNVGIGTTTPWGKLSVTGSGTGTGLAFAVADSANTPRFVIQDNGNVGIGTASPSYLLDVNKSTTGGTVLQVKNPTAGTGNYTDIRGTADSGSIDIVTTSSLWTTSGWNVQDGSTVGASGVGGLSVGASSPTGVLRLYTGGSATGNERMRITSAGNVGIGTTSPAYRLQVAGDSGGTTSGIIASTGTGGDGTSNGHGFVINNIGWANNQGLWKIVSKNDVKGLAFYGNTANAGDFSTNVQPLFLAQTGNVGIGTTSPSARLDVGGYGANELGYTPNNAIRLFDNYNGISDISIKNVNTNISAASAFQAFDSGGSYVSLAMPGTGNTAAPLFGLARASTTYLFSNTVGVNPARNLAIGTIAANTLTLGTNNTARMTFDASGNVGIGTASPSEKLEVGSVASGANIRLNTSSYGNNGLVRFYGTDGSEKLQLGANGNASSFWYTPGDFSVFTGTVEHLTVKSSGNVGIGTTTPDSKLVVTDTNSSVLKLNTTNAPSAYYTRFVNNYDTTQPFYIDNGGGKVLGIKTNMGGDNNPATYIGNYYNMALVTGANDPTSSNVRLFINSTGNVGIGTTNPIHTLDLAASSPFLGLTSSNGTGNYRNWGITSQGGIYGLEFRVSDSAGGDASAAGSTKLAITNDGNVGIGTTSPISAVGGSLTAAGVLAAKGYLSANQTDAAILQYINNEATLRAYGATAGTGFLTFRTGGGGGIGDAEAMRITSTGNVGIGTTTPAAKLDVEGNVSLGEAGTNAVLTLRDSQSSAGFAPYITATGLNSSYASMLFNVRYATTNVAPLVLNYSRNVGIGGSITSADTLAGASMVVQGTGNVGIGTTTPWGNLSIATTAHT